LPARFGIMLFGIDVLAHLILFFAKLGTLILGHGAIGTRCLAVSPKLLFFTAEVMRFITGKLPGANTFADASALMAFTALDAAGFGRSDRRSDQG
jgi:hypothetical protein